MKSGSKGSRDIVYARFPGGSSDFPNTFDKEMDGDWTVDVLYVDCLRSALHNLNSELYDLEFDEPSVNNPADDKESTEAARNEMVNDTDLDQNITISLSAEVKTSIEMFHETQLNELTETKFSKSFNLNRNFPMKKAKLNAGIGVTVGTNARKLTEKFASEGEIKIETQKTMYKFHDDVLALRKARTIVAIYTNRLEGDSGYTAYYNITKKHFDRKDGFDIKKAFRRLGYDHLQLDNIGNSKIIKLKGKMSISTGFNTKVLIESCPLHQDCIKPKYRQLRDLTDKVI